MISQEALNQIEHIKKRCSLIKPLVVIRCITYNHELYLRDALEGFVMQKTDFPFIAVVHDDASTDGTAEILKEYAEKYPDIIFPIYERENQYSKRDGSLGKIMNKAIDGSNAKYIAYCEGDDYWMNPLKLQKQVSFLESHPDYSITFHSAKVVDETKTKKMKFDLEERDYTTDEAFMNWIIPTASIVMRKEALKINTDPRLLNGDIWLILSGLDHGKGHAFKEHMSVYRITSNGITIKRNKEEGINHRIKYIPHHKYLKETFNKISNNTYSKKQTLTYYGIGNNLLKSNIFESSKYFFNSFLLNPLYFFRLMSSTLYHLIKNKINF